MGLLSINELGRLGAGVIGTAYSYDPHKEIDQAIKDLETPIDRSEPIRCSPAIPRCQTGTRVVQTGECSWGCEPDPGRADPRPRLPAPSIAVGEPHPSAPILPPPPLRPSAEHEARMEALRLQRERLEAELKREELLRLRMRKRPAPRPPVTGSAAPSTPAPRPQPVRLRSESEGYSNLLLFAAGVVVALLLTR